MTGPSRWRQWVYMNMIAAMESIKGEQNIKWAVELHGIPRITLQDHVKGRVTHGVNPGHQPYLQLAQEKELSCFLMEVASVGYGRTKKEVKHLAKMGAKDKVFYHWHLRISPAKCPTGGSGDSYRGRRQLPLKGRSNSSSTDGGLQSRDNNAGFWSAEGGVGGAQSHELSWTTLATMLTKLACLLNTMLQT